MAKFLSLIPRQMIMGQTSTSIYSEIFEVSEATSVNLELRIYASSGLGANMVSGAMEQTDDPYFTGVQIPLSTPKSQVIATMKVRKSAISDLLQKPPNDDPTGSCHKRWCR